MTTHFLTCAHTNCEKFAVLCLLRQVQPLEERKICLLREVESGFVGLARMGELGVEYDVREICSVEQRACSSVTIVG